MGSNLDFLYRGYVKAIFSNDQSLNLVSNDLGDGMINIDMNEENIVRLKTATGTVASASTSVEVSLAVQILKTSVAYDIWEKRILGNGIVKGTVTIYDDVNRPMTLTQVSIHKDSLTSNASEAQANYRIVGNLAVNNDLIV